MNEENLGRVERRPTTVDLSWFLDLDKNDQLDLDPSYQRRSVWTPSDRRYFLDTIFRNYPSPAIFLHKSINDDGDVMYHVVDGKQRISTILMFAANRLALPVDFGDSRLDGKRWKALEPSMRRLFWNYPIPIEQIDALQGPVIKDVFARLNKNSRKLTRQELRHARFDGWFISFVEAEVLDPVWKAFKVRTTAKEKRMVDVQNVSELCEILIRQDVVGFDQLALDQLYADLDEVETSESEFDVEAFQAKFASTKAALAAMEETNNSVSERAQPFVHLYSLWSLLALEDLNVEQAVALAPRYADFMARVSTIDLGSDSEPDAIDEMPDFDERETLFPEALQELEVAGDISLADKQVVRYKLASVGATTEPPQRRARLEALRSLL